eukprot:745752-Hanusia_phi.AAC.1
MLPYHHRVPTHPAVGPDRHASLTPGPSPAAARNDENDPGCQKLPVVAAQLKAESVTVVLQRYPGVRYGTPGPAGPAAPGHTAVAS